jgi:flagellar protein FliS
MHNSSYLESKVLTASPERLHLMLIEGSIRFGRQAEGALKRGEAVAAAGPLLRLVNIVGEMLAGLRENKSELNRRLTDVYWFLFRRVSEAKINSDSEALAEALRILEIERETWHLLCEKLANSEDTLRLSAPHSTAFGVGDARRKNAVSWEA